MRGFFFRFEAQSLAEPKAVERAMKYIQSRYDINLRFNGARSYSAVGSLKFSNEL